MHKSLFFLTPIFIICFFLAVTNINAITMSDNNYVLEFGTLESAAGLSSGANNKLNISLGQTAPGLFTGTNYKVRSGFQYIKSIIPFSFTIDSIGIDFGILSPTFAQTRTNTLTVGNGSANGYQVTAYEDHQLYGPNFNFIPNTTCDNGSCNTQTAAVWTSSTTYGFGYNCSDSNTPTHCPTGGNSFTNNTYYKQFADLTRNQTAQTVMQATTANKATSSASVTITYKVNISGTQAAGVYRNDLFYVATPLY